MPRHRFALMFALAALLCSCSLREPAPGLLNTLAFGPELAEVGDRLEVIGTGFPEGKAGTVTFRGAIHRPGSAPSEAEIVAPATSTSQNRITILLTEDLAAAFCGAGEDARHATFRGDVEVAFAPRVSGAPPVVGVVRDVIVDVMPPDITADQVATRQQEGERALDFLGLAAQRADGTGLVIDRVAPASRAEAAGLRAGDRLIRFEGVRVREPADVSPSGETKHVELAVRRGRLQDPLVRHVDVEGFRPAPPSDLAGAAILIGAVAAVLLALAFPTARVLTWAERRVVQRLRGSAAAGGRKPKSWASWLRHGMAALWREDLAPRGGESAIGRAVPYVLFLGVTSVFVALPLCDYIIAPELDLPVLYLAAVSGLITVGLLLGGWRNGGGWRLVAALRSALEITTAELPPLVAVAAVVLTSGSIRFTDIVSSQGPLPWEWNVFGNPILLLAFVCFAAPAVVETSRASVELPEAESSAAVDWTVRSAAARSLIFIAEWGNVFITSSIGSALFLGGWQLPFTSPGEQAASPLLGLLGALVYQIKAWCLVGCVLAVRWALPRVRIDQAMGLVLRWLLPAAALVAVFTALWLAGLRNIVLRSSRDVASYILFGATLVVVASFARRVVNGVRRADAGVHVNPWL